MLPLSGLDCLVIGLAALTAGFVNALAGGGTLISFPVLVAVGLPAVAANVTNTVSLIPGFLGGMLAQRRDLRGQARRIWVAVPASVLGGIVGALLLLWSGERVFLALVPWLILLASALLAAQEPVRAWLLRRSATSDTGRSAEARMVVPLAVAAIYGGYFGAGLGVVLLAGLGLILHDSLTRLNAMKQVLSISISLAAGAFFLFSGEVVWPVALIMATGALVGGGIGGGLATRINPALLRRLVIGLGVAVAIAYLVR